MSKLYKNMDSESKRELQLDVKKVNQRLREIEKKGLQNSSNWYQSIVKMKFDGSKAFSLDSKGRVKLRTDFSSIDNAKVINKIQNVIDYTLNKGVYADRKAYSNTSTITGIQNKYKKAHESYKKSQNKNVSFSTYIDVWKNEKFRQLVKQYGYSEVMSMLAETNIPLEEAVDVMYDAQDIASMRRELKLDEEVKINSSNMTTEEIEALFQHLR